MFNYDSYDMSLKDRHIADCLTKDNISQDYVSHVDLLDYYSLGRIKERLKESGWKTKLIVDGIYVEFKPVIWYGINKNGQICEVDTYNSSKNYIWVVEYYGSRNRYKIKKDDIKSYNWNENKKYYHYFKTKQECVDYFNNYKETIEHISIDDLNETILFDIYENEKPIDNKMLAVILKMYYFMQSVDRKFAWSSRDLQSREIGYKGGITIEKALYLTKEYQTHFDYDMFNYDTIIKFYEDLLYKVESRKKEIIKKAKLYDRYLMTLESK